MIAFSNLIGSRSSRKSCSSTNCQCKPAGSLVPGLESVHAGVSNLGATMVGRSASRKSLVGTLHAKSTVGSSSVVADPSGADSAAERECGA
jgi:hypothetical protein